MLPPLGFRDVVLCGTGATSRVFRATSAASGRTVALKRLHRQLARTPEAVARLRRELEALGKLRHRAIVPVFDVIRWQGDPTIVMDYVPGRDLKDLIQSKGTLTFTEAERIMRELLDALHVAHGAGIVHRDVKPQNVRIGEDGRVHLLDFGSARLDASSELTTTGTTVGTPDYMPPELFAGPVYDPRADLYGLGATIFEALTGRAPQVAETLTELAWRRTNEDVPRVENLRHATPKHLAQAIDRCLSRSPEHRYSTAAQVVWALDHPDEERRFIARRSSLPPCLHCGGAIPPESNLCPSCGSDHPFCFAPGHASVNLVALKEPALLAEELVSNFPELTVEDLAERFAAVGTAPQRIASLIDKREAIAFSERLRDFGADCQVEDDPGISGANTKAPFWGAIVFIVGAIAAFASGAPLELATFFAFASLIPAITAMFAERLFALDRASQGLLAPRAGSPAPAARFGLMVGAPVLGAAGAALPWFAKTIAVMGVTGALVLEEYTPALFTGAAFTALSAIAARFVRFSQRRKPACGSAEPHLIDKIIHAFSLPNRSISPMKQQIAASLAVLVLALIPLELIGAAAIKSAVPTIWSLLPEDGIQLTSPSPYLMESLESEALTEPATDPDVEPRSFYPPAGSEIAFTPSTGPLLPEWLDYDTETGRISSLLIAAILGIDLALLTLLLYRRRKFARQGRALTYEIDLIPERKSLPISRAPAEMLTGADRIAERKSSDVFLEATKRLATELAHHLDQDEVARLSTLLDRAEARAEKSFRAQCILESDADLALRFELLRLAGRMEAKAAERWAASLPDEEEAV